MMETFTKPIIENRKVVKTIITPEDGLIEIYKCADSGKVLTREKKDPRSGVLHPGVIIGIDKYNRLWVAHNHIDNKVPTFDLCEKYLAGEKMLFDNRPVKFSPSEIVKRAILEVSLGKKYNGVNYNCQTFINLVVRNEHTSEAVEKITNSIMIIGVITDRKSVV